MYHPERTPPERRCSGCGAMLGPRDARCAVCGRVQVPARRGPFTTDRWSGWRFLLPAILIILLVLALAAVILYTVE